MITTKKLEKYLAQNNTDSLAEIFSSKDKKYHDLINIAGDKVVQVRYPEGILKGTSKDKNSINKKESTFKNHYQKLSEEKKEQEKIKVANNRRRRKVKSLIKCNIKELNKFITLTFGHQDYYEKITSKLKKEGIKASQFSQDEIQELKGVKSINYSSPLKEKNNFLRNKVRKLLEEVYSEKLKLIQEDVKKQFPNKATKRINQKAKREFIRQMDNSISSGDPTDINYANKEFNNFRNKIKREKENFEYIAVIEFGENGRIHYHILANLNFAESEIKEKWGLGIVEVRNVYDPYSSVQKCKTEEAYQRAADGLSQYLTKENLKNAKEPKKLKGKNLYKFSRGLKTACKITDKKESGLILRFLENSNYSPVAEFTNNTNLKMNWDDFEFNVVDYIHNKLNLTLNQWYFEMEKHEETPPEKKVNPYLKTMFIRVFKLKPKLYELIYKLRKKTAKKLLQKSKLRNLKVISEEMIEDIKKNFYLKELRKKLNQLQDSNVEETYTLEEVLAIA